MKIEKIVGLNEIVQRAEKLMKLRLVGCTRYIMVVERNAEG